MSIEQINIYVDGQKVKTDYCIRNDCVMVPSLFLKYTSRIVAMSFCEPRS